MQQGVPTRASLRIDRQNQRRSPRLPQGSRRPARLWRTRRGIEPPTANRLPQPRPRIAGKSGRAAIRSACAARSRPPLYRPAGCRSGNRPAARATRDRSRSSVASGFLSTIVPSTAAIAPLRIAPRSLSAGPAPSSSRRCIHLRRRQGLAHGFRSDLRQDRL